MQTDDAAPVPCEPPACVDVTGPWFEDLEPGLEFDAPAVTVTAGHAALYQAITGDRLKLPLDHASSRRVTGVDAPLAHPLLAINVAIGQSTWASQRVKANLAYRGIRLLRPVFLGDTLYTRTRVVGMRRNSARPPRAPTGVVALEMRTENQRGEAVMHGWRFPMIPCRQPDAIVNCADDLDRIGRGGDVEASMAAVPPWDLTAFRRSVGAAAQGQASDGTRLNVAARDTITAAPELVRMTLNLAMAHTDAALSHLGERLVYGGHTIGLAFAQVTRALPDLVTVVSWTHCGHVGAVAEQDCVSTAVTIKRRWALPQGELLELHVQSDATRRTATERAPVLDWTLHAWTA